MKKTIIISVFFATMLLMKVSAQTTPPPPPTPTQTPAFDTAVYVGKYKFEGLPFEYMVITVQSGKLFFTGGEYSGPLEPVKDKPDVFASNNNTAIFSFGRNPEKKVTDLGVEYGGQTFSGKKEEKKDPGLSSVK